MGFGRVPAHAQKQVPWTSLPATKRKAAYEEEAKEVMNRVTSFLAVALAAMLGFFGMYVVSQPSGNSAWPYITTNYVEPYTSIYGEDEPTDIQCPIPMTDRVKNGTGIQCVWSSIETLGRWAEEPKLVNPPLTSRSDCKSYSGPGLAAKKLKELGVRFEQVANGQDRQSSIALMKRATSEGRAALFGVPGHAMVCVHYDEAADTVKWIDNSDRSLKVQTTTIERFNRMWDGWVLVIYADNDIIPQKVSGQGGAARNIPIFDPNNPNHVYPKDFIPLPQQRYQGNRNR